MENKMKSIKCITLAFTACLVVVGSQAIAEEMIIPNTFSANTPAVAAEVNANFTAVKTAVDAKGLINFAVLPVTCKKVDVFSTSYVKIADIGTYDKQISDSILEIQFHGDLYAGTMDGTGAIFELRVDDDPTTNGWARIALKKGSMGNVITGGSMTGIFSDLDIGEHTVSIWIKGMHAGGTEGYTDPGCWSSSHVVIKEIN